MRSLKGIVAGLAGLAIMAPISEIVVTAGQLRRWNVVLVFAAAFAISMAQLAGEYWLVGCTSSGAGLWFRRWWANARIRPFWEDLKFMVMADTESVLARFRPWFRAGGYTTMCVACVNPFTFLPPFGRITAVTIWRTADLRGSLVLIIACSLAKLMAIMAGISFFVR